MSLITLTRAKKYTNDRLKESGVKKYTVSFSGSTSAGTRADDAVGMVAGVAVDDAVVDNDFDGVSFFNRPICCGHHDEDGKFYVNAYRGEPGFAWDGSNGDVFYEETPFYWKGDLITTVSVTGTPCEGYELSPRFPNGIDKQYSPVFWMSMVGGVAASRSGYLPVYTSIDTGMSNARTYNATKGHIETIAVRMSDYILQLVEFATKDVQNVMMGVANLRSDTDTAVIAEIAVNRIVLTNAVAAYYVVGQTIVIGTTQNDSNVAAERSITSIEAYDVNNMSVYFDGNAVDIAVGNFVSSRVWKNGATNIVVASSGSPVSNTDGKHPCIWRGKVDPWGEGFSDICDVLIKRMGTGTAEDPYVYTPYYLSDPRKYAAGAITADFVGLSYKMATVDGYAKALGYDARYKWARLTDDVGASSTTYLAAYYYYPRYDISAVCVGGYFSLGRYCSPAFFYCDPAPSISHFNRLSRLFVTP